mgnify:CR=1 FL=1
MIDTSLTTPAVKGKPSFEPVIRDAAGRRFRDLRLSLTARCNLSCVYCVPEGAPQPRERFASPATHAERVRRLHERLRQTQVRQTGREPTQYPELPELVRRLREAGIPRIAMTTNGYFLERLAGPLAQAGLESLNVSVEFAPWAYIEEVRASEESS